MLTAIIVQKFAELWLVQDAVSPRGHSHLFGRVIDVALFVVFEGRLESELTLAEASSQWVLVPHHHQLVTLPHLCDSVPACHEDGFVIGQIDSPVHVTDQELKVLLSALFVRVGNETLAGLSVAKLQVVEPLFYFLLAAGQVAIHEHQRSVIVVESQSGGTFVRRYSLDPSLDL